MRRPGRWNQSVNSSVIALVFIWFKGRLYVEIPKAERGLWMRLLKSKEKHPTLRIWWDMKDQHEKAMEEFGRMLEQKEEREEKV